MVEIAAFAVLIGLPLLVAAIWFAIRHGGGR